MTVTLSPVDSAESARNIDAIFDKILLYLNTSYLFKNHAS